MSEITNNKKNISRHILPTSSNLLGLCFVILSFIKLMKLGNEVLIDELVAIAIFLFLAASILSYASMRSSRNTERYEKIADIIFLSGLFLLSLGSMMIIFEVI
jgi:multisubunit Na+/H+ antiporter MnhG subunit